MASSGSGGAPQIVGVNIWPCSSKSNLQPHKTQSQPPKTPVSQATRAEERSCHRFTVLLKETQSLNGSPLGGQWTACQSCV
ncbi:hypothetical protein GN956_G7747 [Arapaima gigas]